MGQARKHEGQSVANDNNVHDLVEFMRQVSAEMASEYDRIRKRALEDPGTAGDQGEENWASLLRDWLPATYQVVTKGRIIGEDGRISPQVDLVVLKDIYPKKLLDKKLYLANGVAAAFECKTTLRPEHIEKAVETSADIKRLFPTRAGTLYRELHAPILFGLLAHSHDWKSPASKPENNVTSKLVASDQAFVTHPREGLDLLCVADLGTWALTKLAFLRPEVFNSISQFGYHVPSRPQYAKGIAWTSYFSHAMQANNQQEAFTPIGCLIAFLSRKLAWGNPSLRQLAEYYPKTGIEGSGTATVRYWAPQDIYSDETYAQLSARFGEGEWSEWSHQFL